MTEQAQRQPFWQELGLPAPGTYISREDYEQLPDVNIHMEWLDGVVVYPHWNEVTMSPSPSSRHQRTVIRLVSLLQRLIPDGDLLTAPMDLLLGGQTVQPDVFWASDKSPCIDQTSHYLGPPDLVIEVLSPNNTENDRVTKFDLYERTGVAEYWIVNPDEGYIEVYTLDEDIFRRAGAFKDGQAFESLVLKKSISVDAIVE